MTRVVCTQHGPGCERIHVGDIVRVVLGPQLGYMQTGEVVEEGVVSFKVHFPDGVAELDANGSVIDMIADDLYYTEAELERMSL